MKHDKFMQFLDTLCENSTDTYKVVKNGYMAIYQDIPKRIFNECAMGIHLFDDCLLEGEETAIEEDSIEEQGDSKYDTIGDLDSDFEVFMSSLSKSQHPEMLEFYSKDEYKAKNAKLYKLKGIDAGFAVAGDGDIISVHNNSSQKGLGRKLIQLAKQEGGSKLDHFDMPTLNKIYSAEGFKEYNRMEWDDQYAPKNWRYEKYGRPDVIERKL